MNKQDLVFWLAENVSTEDFNLGNFVLPERATQACWTIHFIMGASTEVIDGEGVYGKITETDVRLAKVTSKHKTPTTVPERATVLLKQDDGDKPTALDVQVGADHYKQQKIQPVEYIHANNIGFMEGNVIKYVTRHKLKNGKQDLEKAIHFLQMLIELEYGE